MMQDDGQRMDTFNPVKLRGFYAVTPDLFYSREGCGT